MIRLSRLVAILAVAACGIIGSDARAGVITYVTNLSGSSESPPNGSPGTGFALVDFDLEGNSMRVFVMFSGLTGTTTASHIHSPTTVPHTGNAGIATHLPSFTGFPLGVTSGVYNHTFDLSLASTYNPAFVTANGGTVEGAAAALAAGLAAGKAYLNVHSTQFPGGEIRGFLHVVPEPGSLGLMAAGGIGALLLARRRRGC